MGGGVPGWDADRRPDAVDGTITTAYSAPVMGGCRRPLPHETRRQMAMPNPMMGT